MANEILYSGTADLRLSAVMLAQEVMSLLYDSADLRDFVSYQGNLNGSGSLANKIGQVNWGDAMGAITEGNAVSNTDLTHSTVSITVALQALRREVSDHMRASGRNPTMDDYAMGMAIGFRLRFTDLVCALFSSITASVNSTGVLLTVDDFFDGKADLRSAYNPAGEIVFIHSLSNINNLISDLRGETGPVAEFKEMNQALMSASAGSGIMGNLLGVTIVGSDSVPTSGGDYVGAMFHAGAFGWNSMSAPDMSMNPNPVVVLPGGDMYIEFDRTADSVLSGIQGNAFVGVGILENARATKLINLQ